jgi:hypothetical protein
MTANGPSTDAVVLSASLVEHSGQCHCGGTRGPCVHAPPPVSFTLSHACSSLSLSPSVRVPAVRFRVQAPRRLRVYVCNCSICAMKRNDHFIVPRAAFSLDAGANVLTTYTFNTGRAQHTFCRVCGVQPFYTPRSNPDGVAVTLACVTSSTVGAVDRETFDGRNWEAAYAVSDIAARSQPG